MSLVKKTKDLIRPIARPMLKIGRNGINKCISLYRENTRGRSFDLSKKVLINLDGFSMFVMPSDYAVGASILHDHIFEPHVTRIIKQELHNGDTFLDIGANIGYFTMLASSIVGSQGKVIAFEPNPQNLQLIYASQLQNAYNNQSIYPYAVSDKKAILRFVTAGSNGGVVNVAEHKHSLLVPAVTIDEELPDQPISLIKIDIEAHEPFALRGMQNLIKKYRPKIVTEFHPWAMEINNTEKPETYLQQLSDLGYRLAVVEMDRTLDLEVAEIMPYWKSLNSPTVHLDLFCKPK